jgi:hypothetical protein
MHFGRFADRKMTLDFDSDFDYQIMERRMVKMLHLFLTMAAIQIHAFRYDLQVGLYCWNLAD